MCIRDRVIRTPRDSPHASGYDGGTIISVEFREESADADRRHSYECSYEFRQFIPQNNTGPPYRSVNRFRWTGGLFQFLGAPYLRLFILRGWLPPDTVGRNHHAIYLLLLRKRIKRSQQFVGLTEHRNLLHHCVRIVFSEHRCF